MARRASNGSRVLSVTSRSTRAKGNRMALSPRALESAEPAGCVVSFARSRAGGCFLLGFALSARTMNVSRAHLVAVGCLARLALGSHRLTCSLVFHQRAPESNKFRLCLSHCFVPFARWLPLASPSPLRSLLGCGRSSISSWPHGSKLIHAQRSAANIRMALHFLRDEARHARRSFHW